MLYYYYGNVGLLVIGLFFNFAFPPLLRYCKCNQKWLHETRTVADDFYKECAFEFLTKELSRTREELAQIISRANEPDQLFYQQNVKIVPVFESEIQRVI